MATTSSRVVGRAAGGVPRDLFHFIFFVCFSVFIALLRCNSHSIKFSLKYTVQWFIVSVV